MSCNDSVWAYIVHLTALITDITELWFWKEETAEATQRVSFDSEISERAGLAEYANC